MKELVLKDEYLAINSLTHQDNKFFKIIEKHKKSEFEQNETSKIEVEHQVQETKTHRKSSDFQNKIEEEESISKWSQSQKKLSLSEMKKSEKDFKENKSNQILEDAKESEIGSNPKPPITTFPSKITNHKIDLEIPKEIRQETNVDLGKGPAYNSRSFFGYYNFHNFFNHFIILYERLKFIKTLTKRQGAYCFIKQVIFLYLTSVIDSEFFEDILSCLLSEYTGVFLNLDKIFSNIIKEIPTHEIDQFVININQNLFRKKEKSEEMTHTPEPQEPKNGSLLEEERIYPKTQNEEEWLFLKTCHKLSLLTFKSKANCKQSQIQSYINNNNLVNDHLLKFEFLLKDQKFIIHKIKSFYNQITTKQVNFYIF
jgi:hypothetical protein